MRAKEFAAVVRERWPLFWKRIEPLDYQSVVAAVDKQCGQVITWDDLRCHKGFPAMMRYLDEQDSQGRMEEWKLPDAVNSVQD